MITLLTLILVLCLVGAGVFLGLAVAQALNEDAHEDLARQEVKVRAEMDALTRAQRLNTVFLTARRAMWEEARRHPTSGIR